MLFLFMLLHQVITGTSAHLFLPYKQKLTYCVLTGITASSQNITLIVLNTLSSQFPRVTHVWYLFFVYNLNYMYDNRLTHTNCKHLWLKWRGTNWLSKPEIRWRDIAVVVFCLRSKLVNMLWNTNLESLRISLLVMTIRLKPPHPEVGLSHFLFGLLCEAPQPGPGCSCLDSCRNG